MFEDYDPEDGKLRQLMLAINTLNAQYEQDKVRFAVMGFKLRWQIRAQFRSNRWTTRWEELIEVKAQDSNVNSRLISMVTLINTPTKIEAVGSSPMLIEESVGWVNFKTDSASITIKAPAVRGQ